MKACVTALPRVQRGALDLLSAEDLTPLVLLGKAVGDPIRLQMLYLLGQCPDLCTCEFEELLNLSQSKVSYHLKVLLDTGLVTRETYGTWSHYRLNQPAMLNQFSAFAPATILATPALA